MSYYVVCSECGCNLDPGERCDCKRSAFLQSPQTVTQTIRRHSTGQSTGQSTTNLTKPNLTKSYKELNIYACEMA